MPSISRFPLRFRLNRVDPRLLNLKSPHLHELVTATCNTASTSKTEILTLTSAIRPRYFSTATNTPLHCNRQNTELTSCQGQSTAEQSKQILWCKSSFSSNLKPFSKCNSRDISNSKCAVQLKSSEVHLWVIPKRNLGWIGRQRMAKLEHYPPKVLMATTEESLESADEVNLSFAFPIPEELRKPSASDDSRVIFMSRYLDERWGTTGVRLQDKLELIFNQNKRKMKKYKKPNLDTTRCLSHDLDPISYRDGHLGEKSEEEAEAEEKEKNLNIFSVSTSESGEEEVDRLDTDTPLRDILNKVTCLRMFGTDFKVRINPPSVGSKAKLTLDPIPGFPLMPSVDFESKGDREVAYHWLVEKEAADTEFNIKNFVIDFDSKTGKRTFSHPLWEHRGCAECFVPKASDTGRKVAAVIDPGQDSLAKVLVHPKLISDSPTEEMVWEERQKSTPDFLENSSYRILSYNLLSDLYLDLKGKQDTLWYPYCPKENQEHNYRYPLLLKELPGYKADIICLQEVDNRLWTRYLEPMMKGLGWNGSLFLKGGQISEGVAICYRNNRFKCLSTHNILLADMLSPHKTGGDENKDLKDFITQVEIVNTLVITRPTVLQVLVLEDVNNGSVFVVGNTHLHFKPEQSYIRLIQMALVTRHLEAVLQLCRQQFPDKRVGLVVGADLNSLSDSAAVKYLLEGSLSADNPEWRGSYGAVEESLQGIETSHSLKLEDVCRDIPYSNFTEHPKGGFSGRLDYILTEKDMWKVDGVLPAPSHSLVTKYQALPSPIAPSDHIAIGVDLTLT